MNNSSFRVYRLLVSTCPLLAVTLSFAADTNSVAADNPGPQPAVAAAVVATPPPAKLPYGVDDVLKLSRAQISEDIIVNYVQNSGTIYNLGPKDIVYLKNEGVTDRVVNAMLDQRKAVAQVSANVAPQQMAPTVPTAPIVPDANVVPAAPTYGQAPPVYQPVPAPEPAPPASSVYVIPYPYPYTYYGGYGYPYRYYSPYYYFGPSISFGFGFGGHGHFHGGFHHH